MTAVFLLGVFWPRATTRAANLVLTAGTAFCLIVGILYLWGPQSDIWPHFMMLSFLLCVILIIAMMGISMFDKQSVTRQAVTTFEGQNHLSRMAITLWLLLATVMVGLYIFFN